MSLAISLTHLENDFFRINKLTDFCNALISRKATVPFLAGRFLIKAGLISLISTTLASCGVLNLFPL
jgi:hypothetical protein